LHACRRWSSAHWKPRSKGASARRPMRAGWPGGACGPWRFVRSQYSPLPRRGGAEAPLR